MVASQKGHEHQQVHEGGQCKPSIEDFEGAITKGSIISPLLRNTIAPIVCVDAYTCACLLQCQGQCVQYESYHMTCLTTAQQCHLDQLLSHTIEYMRSPDDKYACMLRRTFRL